MINDNHTRDDGIKIIALAVSKRYKPRYPMWKQRYNFKDRKIDQPVYHEIILPAPKVRDL